MGDYNGNTSFAIEPEEQPNPPLLLNLKSNLKGNPTPRLFRHLSNTLNGVHRGGPGVFRQGLTLPTRGLIYGVQNTIKAKNLRKNSFSPSDGELPCSDGGYSPSPPLAPPLCPHRILQVQKKLEKYRSNCETIGLSSGILQLDIGLWEMKSGQVHFLLHC